MPTRTLESMQQEITRISRESIALILAGSLDAAYNDAKRYFERCFSSEKQAITDNKDRALRTVSARHSVWLSEHNIKQKNAQLELNTTMNAEYGEAGYLFDRNSGKRQTKLQQLNTPYEQELAATLSLQREEMSQVKSYEEKKKQDALTLLHQRYDTTNENMQQEHQRVKLMIMGDVFFNRHIMPSLELIASSVSIFFDQHPWAVDDRELILQCFDYTRRYLPWEEWSRKVRSKFESAGTAIWQGSKFSTSENYANFWSQKTTLSKSESSFDKACLQELPRLVLRREDIEPALRRFFYAPAQFSSMYVTNKRQGIKSFSYAKDPRSVDLVFRRVDWLRLIKSMVFSSPRYVNNVGHNRLFPVLPLSIDELSRFSQEPDVKVIVLNVGTELQPLWVLLQKDARHCTVFVPEGAQYAALRESIHDVIRQQWPAGMPVVSYHSVNMDEHTLDRHDAQTMPPALLWHAVLGSRVLSFVSECNVAAGVALKHYRHTVPLSLLLETTLNYAILEGTSNLASLSGLMSLLMPSITRSPGYVSRADIGQRYSLRTFRRSPVFLFNAWDQSSHLVSRTCLDFTPDWCERRHLDAFLSAVDTRAVDIEHHVNAPPTLLISPQRGLSRRVLTQHDFFYLMVLVNQHGINRLTLNNVNSTDLWRNHWQDYPNDLALAPQVMPAKSSKDLKTVRNLLDCDVHLTTVTPLSTVLPNVLRYAAFCAARNRLMHDYFSPAAIASDSAIEALWNETGIQSLSLMKTIAAMPDEPIENFFDQLTTFTGLAGQEGWFQQGCTYRLTPRESEQRLIWDFAQIAQMGIPGLDVIFKQWNTLLKPIFSLSFDLNCQTMLPQDYLKTLCAYASQYSKNPLARLNLFMPANIRDPAFASTFAMLLTILDKRHLDDESKSSNDVYLYHMQTQSPRDRCLFFNALLKEVLRNKTITLIRIPAYDRTVSLASDEACQAHDLYRQLQNCILNNRRCLEAEKLKHNTDHLQAYIIGRALPEFTALLEVKEDCVMLPSEGEATYVIGGGTNGIQQQLQQAQQQQRQVSQQRQLELAKKIDVEEEAQILVYKPKGQVLWSKETIDSLGRTFWEQLPESTKALSGFDEKHPSPLSQLFNDWVGSERDARYVVKFIEQDAAEKIMQHASTFRFGLFYDNLPCGFFLANKDDALVLCFDKGRERDELQLLALARKRGVMIPRQMSKIILHEPKKAIEMPGGDDRQFATIPVSGDLGRVKPGYWRHLVTRTKPTGYLNAARQILNETPEADFEVLDSRIQASLQLTAFKARRKPSPSEASEVVTCIQSWVSSFIETPKYVEILFARKANGERLDNHQVSVHLHGFGQIMHAFDATPIQKEQHGSSLFMQLSNQIYQAFRDNPAYFCIWRDRLLSPSANWTECLHKTDVDAVIQSLRVLENKPEHAAFWWNLVDAHGQTTGHMQYAPLWLTCYQFFQYLDTQKLLLTPIVLAQWQRALLSSPVNGQVLLQRISSGLKRAACSAVQRIDAKDAQQHILDSLGQIEWWHDGLFYMGRYEGFSGFWDQDLCPTRFAYASDIKRASYIPALDAFSNSTVPEDQLIQELTAAIRFNARYYGGDRGQYERMKAFLQRSWADREALLRIPAKGRVDVLRLILMSFVLGQDRADAVPVSILKKLCELAIAPNTSDALSSISHVRSLDTIGVREVFWPLRFQHLPVFIRALSFQQCKPFLIRMQNSPQDGIALAKQAEVALSCFESELFKHMVKTAGIKLETQDWPFNAWFKALESKPYLRAFPWLILDVMNHQLDDGFSELLQYGGLEYERLMRQMHSIDFARSTLLPTRKIILDYLPIRRSVFLLFGKSLSEQYRINFIQNASHDGCYIVDQCAGFRVLTEKEKLQVETAFQRRMDKTPWFSINNALFVRFIQQVAVSGVSAPEVQASMENFIDMLFVLHNKVYYNELGQLLGLLASSVSEHGTRANDYYSLPQLHAWISSLVGIADNRDRHYPVHLLRELLLAPGEQTRMSPGLLKPINRLNECQEHVLETSLRRKWLRLNQSSLPNLYSAFIARLMLRSKELSQLSDHVQTLFEKKVHSPQFFEALYQFLQQPTVLDGQFPSVNVSDWCVYLTSQVDRYVNADMYDQAVLHLTEYLAKQAIPKCDITGNVLPDWSVPLSELDTLWSLVRFEETRSYFGFGQSNKSHAQRKLIILASATRGLFDIPKDAGHLLEKMDADAMDSLIDYYHTGACLSLDDLRQLLPVSESTSKLSKDGMLDCLHHYETVIQGQTPDGRPKRVYSADSNALLRVISGFEKKGQGRSPDEEQQRLISLFYSMNEYSQLVALDKLRFIDLQAELQAAKASLTDLKDSGDEGSSHEAQQASARMLACMREVMLRRTGKWANHTQMLALLYAACHNDEGLIHQVRTGQGKSIISLMRASYLALTGDVVDVFSAKDSLSQRDYHEAKSVLGALEIPCSYITPASPMEACRQRTCDVGAVNFATIGNFSLFLSRNAWMDHDKIYLDKAHRVAFLDEADHILLDDQTQFNLPDPGSERDAYNFDEWVYRESYRFYCDVLANDPAFISTHIISRQIHLDLLSQRLVSLTRTMPEDSKFFAVNLLPAMTSKGDRREGALKKRDEALVYLLKAAHAAHILREGVDLCSGTDQRTMQGQVVPVHILQVMIGNQVQQGATYSDAVHQFACVRKNEEAAARGELPDYFVDPESRIVLSQNCPSVLLQHYRKIEGCSGTAGDSYALAQYDTVFNLTHVVKLPTHEVTKSVFKPTKYVRGFDQQVQKIVDMIAEHAVIQPMLITCKDDIEVARLYQAVKEKVQQSGLDINLIKDTNDSGKDEADVLPLTGKIRSVTLSSRMGRGTDIKPEGDYGLYVLRTYLASTRVIKQEIGRQGRNNDNGVCESIIDLDELDKEYDAYGLIEGGQERLDRIKTYENSHLDAKIAKHHKKGSHKLDWLIGEKRENYIKARVCLQFRHQLHEQKHLKLRRQEAMIAWMSTAVEACLRSPNLSTTASQAIKEEWKTCRMAVEKSWHQHLAAPPMLSRQDKRQQWLDFVEATATSWQSVMAVAGNKQSGLEAGQLIRNFSAESLRSQFQTHLEHSVERSLVVRPAKELYSVPHLDQFITFHQTWMEHAVVRREHCLAHAPQTSIPKLKIEFDGQQMRGLNQLFLQLRKLVPVSSGETADRLFDGLFETLYRALDCQIVFMMPDKLAGELLFKWVDSAYRLLHTLPADADRETIRQQLIFLDTLSRVFGVNPEVSRQGIPNWLPEARLQRFNSGDPTRYSTVSRLVTDMALTVGMPSWQTAQAPIERFMEHVCQSLVQTHWAKLDQQSMINTLHDLLVMPSQRAGAEYVLESLAQGFPTLDGVKTLIYLMLQPALSAAHVNAFKTYVCQNALLLGKPEYACVLPMIVDLTLGEANDAVNHLPAVDVFMHPMAAEDQKSLFNRQFWVFLSQRRPLDKTTIMAFYSFLQARYSLDVAQRVLNLPPYVSLDYIQRVLSAETDQLDCLFGSSQAFNQWMVSQSYFVSAEVYAPYISDSNHWIALFEQLPVQQTGVLFRAMLDSQVPGSLPESMIEQLKSLMTQLPLNADQLHVYCQEMKVLLTLPDEWREALESCLAQFSVNSNRLELLTELSQRLCSRDALGNAFREFPMQCYKAGKQLLPQLISLYQLAITLSEDDSVYLLIAKVIQEVETWDKTIQNVSQWMPIFCQLPKTLQTGFLPVLMTSSFADEGFSQECLSLFQTLLRVMPDDRENGDVRRLAPAVFADWLRYPVEQQAEKTRGLKRLVSISLYPEHEDWTRFMLDSYLSHSIEEPLAGRLVMLTACEQLMHVFDQLPQACRAVFLEKTTEILHDNSLETMEKWQHFLRILRTELPKELPNDKELVKPLVNWLWGKAVQMHFPDDEHRIRKEIKPVIAMLGLLKDAPDTPKDAFVLSKYQQLLEQDTAPEMMNQFRCFVTELPSDYSKESCRAIWHGVETGMLSMNDQHGPGSCRKAIQLTQQALADVKDNTLGTWFVDLEASERRVDLMRGLQHGYISLGNVENESCWKRFTNMIREILNYFPKQFGERYHRYAMDGMKRLTQGLAEMTLIAQLPWMENKPAVTGPVEHETLTDLTARYTDDFKQLKTGYDAAWWKNRDRQRQASDLFKGVLNVDQGLSRDEYYRVILDQIIKTQNDIIESDRDAYCERNKKGYSRLYDLSVKMLVNVASDYLVDHSIDLPSNEDRAGMLKVLLANQLSAHNRVRETRNQFFKLPSTSNQHPALNYLHDAIQSMESGEKPCQP